MHYAIVLVLVAFATPLRAFDYFNGDIDYWNESRPTNKQDPPPPKKKETDRKFDWSKYTDPKNDEFFQEGNYKPPKPFMELARNPNDENIKKWFAVVEAKNRLMSRLQRQLTLYLEKEGKTLKPEHRAVLEKKLDEIAPKQIDVKRFRFRLYFDSQCPHCKNMMQTAHELQAMGYYVEVRQIDRAKPAFAVPFPIVWATPEEVKAKKINSWPVLFVADTSKQLVYRLQGYQPTKTVLGKLSQK